MVLRQELVHTLVDLLIKTRNGEAVLQEIRRFMDNDYDGPSEYCIAFCNITAEIKRRVTAKVGDGDTAWLDSFKAPRDIIASKKGYTHRRTEERVKDQIHFTWEQVNAFVDAAEAAVRDLDDMDASKKYVVLGALQLLTGRRISELTEGRVFTVVGPNALTINKLSKNKAGLGHTFPTIIDASVCLAAIETINGHAKNDPKAALRGRKRVFGSENPLDHNKTRGLYCHVLFDRRDRIGFGVGWGFIVFCKEALGHSNMSCSVHYQCITIEE